MVNNTFIVWHMIPVDCHQGSENTEAIAVGLLLEKNGAKFSLFLDTVKLSLSRTNFTCHISPGDDSSINSLEWVSDSALLCCKCSSDVLKYTLYVFPGDW